MENPISDFPNVLVGFIDFKILNLMEHKNMFRELYKKKEEKNFFFKY